MTNKIDREDMLALTRRMNVARSSFTRIAGCYVDKDGDFDGSFNVNFLKLSAAEKKKNIELAKVVPFAATNVNLKRYEFADADRRPGTVWQLLMAIRECGLKNDALMDSFYDLVMENYKSRRPYAVYIFHDRYDIPAKAADKERLGESEAVFEYLIAVILVAGCIACLVLINVSAVFAENIPDVQAFSVFISSAFYLVGSGCTAPDKIFLKSHSVIPFSIMCDHSIFTFA